MTNSCLVLTHRVSSNVDEFGGKMKTPEYTTEKKLKENTASIFNRFTSGAPLPVMLVHASSFFINYSSSHISVKFVMKHSKIIEFIWFLLLFVY